MAFGKRLRKIGAELTDPLFRFLLRIQNKAGLGDKVLLAAS